MITIVSGSASAEDSIPQAWDMHYPVSFESLLGGRAWNYVGGLADAFEGGIRESVPLESVVSAVERALPEPERLPRNELLALLKSGIAFDRENAGEYQESFEDFIGMMIRLSADKKEATLQEHLAFFWTQGYGIGRTVGERLPGERISDEGLDWLLNSSDADEDSAAQSYEFLEELGMEKRDIAPNVELLGIDAETLDQRREYLEGAGLSLRKILDNPRLLLRSRQQIDASSEALRNFGLSMEQTLQFCGLLAVSEENLRKRRSYLGKKNAGARSDPLLLGMHPETLGERLDYLTMRVGMSAKTAWSNYELLHLDVETLDEKTGLIYKPLLDRDFQPDKIRKFAGENPRLWLKPLSELKKEPIPQETLETAAEQGKKAYGMETNAHALTPEQYRRSVISGKSERYRRAVISKGLVPWSDEELEDLHRMSQSPYFRRGGKVDVYKLTAYANRKRHGGEPVRKKSTVNARLSEYRTRLKKAGKEIKLDEDTGSFLECLSLSETEGDSLEEFAARFNSANNADLTSEVLEEKVADLLAVSSYDALIADQTARQKQKRRRRPRRRVHRPNPEAEDLYRMSQSPYFRSSKGVDIGRLTDWDNRKRHGGEPARTKSEVAGMLSSRMLAKAGNETKLDSETASLLECLFTAERKGYGIRKFAAEFNSANNADLTPEDLEEKVEEVLAAPYDRLISEYKQRIKRGKAWWSDEELEDLHRMSQSPYFRSSKGVDIGRLTDYDNRKHHGGEQVRKRHTVSNRLREYRNYLKNAGKEIKLEAETASLLECLLTAERKGYGIREFADEFNSASGSNLTPEDLDGKVSDLLAVSSYEDLVSGHKQRIKREKIWWSDEELEDLHKMSQSPYFRKYKVVDIAKLTDYDNRKHHGGKPVRTRKSMSYNLLKYRRQLEEAGKEIKLDSETASLLECLRMAEKRGYGIREFAAEFNSANGANLTPEDMGRRVEDLLAAPYEALIPRKKPRKRAILAV